MFALPWAVIATAMVLAVLAAFFAASRPARRSPRSDRAGALGPAGDSSADPPLGDPGHRLPGPRFLVARLFRWHESGQWQRGAPELFLGIVLLVPGLILLAPFFLSLTARLGRRAPLATRLALRDLARYRARSGSALAAISVGVLVAVIVMLAAASRYGNVLDYAGPNLASNGLAPRKSAPARPADLPTKRQRSASPRQEPSGGDSNSRSAWHEPERIAKALGAQLIPLETTNTAIVTTGNDGGRSWNGPIYVATPQLLRAFGIKSSEIDPNADILSSRPGLSGVSGLGLDWASGQT